MRPRDLYVLLTIALAVPGTLFGQYQFIRDSRIQKSRNLAGTVIFQEEKPAARAKIEDCHENWETCDNSTLADEMGRFEFQNVDTKRLHYLKVFWPDANPIEFVIKVTGRGKDIVLTLQPGG